MAIAESDSLTRSCDVELDDYAKYSNYIKFKIFDISNYIKKKFIVLKIK